MTSTPFTPTLALRPSGPVLAKKPGAALSGSAAALRSLLLAAMVAALVALTDRWLGAWTSGHVLLAWLLLWAVVMLGLTWLAGPAAAMARGVLRLLDAASRRMAQARAEARLMAFAQTDPRLMAELRQARQRDLDDTSQALAPLGMEPGWTALASKPASNASVPGLWHAWGERMAEGRVRNLSLYYI